jgi:hypothetical protein
VNDEQEYDGPVIELYVSMSWDARSHRIFTKVPFGWSGMSENEREKFLEAEARAWAEEEMDIGGIVFKDVGTAERETRGYWGDSFSRYDIEDMFGYQPDVKDKETEEKIDEET